MFSWWKDNHTCLLLYERSALVNKIRRDAAALELHICSGVSLRSTSRLEKQCQTALSLSGSSAGCRFGSQNEFALGVCSSVLQWGGQGRKRKHLTLRVMDKQLLGFTSELAPVCLLACPGWQLWPECLDGLNATLDCYTNHLIGQISSRTYMDTITQQTNCRFPQVERYSAFIANSRIWSHHIRCLWIWTENAFCLKMWKFLLLHAICGYIKAY